MFKKLMLLAMVLGCFSGTVMTVIADDSAVDLTTVEEPLSDESSIENKESQSTSPMFCIDAKVTQGDPKLYAVDFMTSSLTISKTGACSYLCKVTLPGHLLLEFTISSECAPVDVFTAPSTYDYVVYAINYLRESVKNTLKEKNIEQLSDEDLRQIEQEVKKYAQHMCNQLVVEHEEQQSVVDAVISVINDFFQLN